GYGGLYAARRLERRMPKGTRVTLVSDENFLLFTPLLPGAAAGTLEPRHVVVPLREELDCTDMRLGQVTGLDPDANELRYRSTVGSNESVRYDQLIVALGSVSRVLPLPGLAEHGLGFKTISEAIALRNRALLNLEVAEALESPAEREPYLTFVFVGAGYAGVEGIAELHDFVADVIDRYPRCRMQGTRWVLVEAEPAIMHEIPPDLAGFAGRELRGRGLEIRTGTRMTRVEEKAVELSDGERIPTRLVCWTAGVRPPALVGELGLDVDRGGRIITDPTLRVKDRQNVWAVGDAAAVPDPAKGYREPCPPTAQHAMRQGKLAAENVAASLGHGRVRKFRYKTLGMFVDLGRNEAVATMVGVKLRGFPAWFAARTYHLLLMPGLGRRTRLMADWTVGLLFGRSSSELGQLGHPPELTGYIETAAQRPDSEPASADRPLRALDGPRPDRHVRSSS
ncbi:MAG: NAD(P)/FAD-dependent oxidoreductase, partial [Chloroflexota bacterium]|nr:NAD(P)/FAD-dependent oxidoreductase [Chloroflexota bacterium]